MAPFFLQAASLLMGTVSAAAEFARGWGKNIDWVSLKEGQRLAREQNKPAMIVIHKTWCRACKALRPRFANSQEIANLSKDFVMINVEDDEEPKSSEFKPDGGYIPRIIFMDSDGKVMTHIINKKADGYKYYYPETESIIESMRLVSRVTGGSHFQRRAATWGNSPAVNRKSSNSRGDSK